MEPSASSSSSSFSFSFSDAPERPGPLFSQPRSLLLATAAVTTSTNNQHGDDPWTEGPKTTATTSTARYARTRTSRSRNGTPNPPLLHDAKRQGEDDEREERTQRREVKAMPPREGDARQNQLERAARLAFQVHVPYQQQEEEREQKPEERARTRAASAGMLRGREASNEDVDAAPASRTRMSDPNHVHYAPQSMTQDDVLAMWNETLREVTRGRGQDQDQDQEQDQAEGGNPGSNQHDLPDAMSDDGSASEASSGALVAPASRGQRSVGSLMDLANEFLDAIPLVDEAGASADIGTFDLAQQLTSPREINVSKAIALKNTMLSNLIRLGFDENVTRAALEAAVEDVRQCESEAEVAYVDVFLAFVRMVGNAHADQRQPGVHFPTLDAANQQYVDHNPAAFKWPVFDMAQFEFGNARQDTCFDSVCVLINLPKVSMDRTEQLMEILSYHLFSRLGDPIQVVIPSVSATGRTKGHAFLEFDDPVTALRSAAAVDGLTWGRGPHGCIRANLFRRYQARSPLRSRPQPQIRRTFACSEAPAIRPPAIDTTLRLQRMDAADDSFRSSDFMSSTQSNDEHASSGVSSESMPSVFSRSPSSSMRSGQGSLRVINSLSSRSQTTNPAMRQRDDIMRLGELTISSGDEEYDDEEEEGAVPSEIGSEIEMPVRGNVTLAQRRMLSTLAPRQTRQQLFQSLPPRPRDGVPPTFSRPVTPDAAPSTTLPPVRSMDTSDGPWRLYCEELLTRNRTMQDQVIHARRRLASLSHNNQKLHLLIDRMERDRDGLLFENDLLQTQLDGREDHEREQQALLREVESLRQVTMNVTPSDWDAIRNHQQEQNNIGFGDDFEIDHGGLLSIDDIEEQLAQHVTAAQGLDDLKAWEQMLEMSLARVRSIKEEIALELQKRVAQQDALDGEQDQKLCVVCLSNDKSILCLPCRHLCLCQECSRHEELDKCPICRLAVESMLLVYA